MSIPDPVLHLSLAELSERVRTRQLDPVELAEAYMDRLERFGRRWARSSPSRASGRWRRRGGRATRSRPGATAGRCTAFRTAPRT